MVGRPPSAQQQLALVQCIGCGCHEFAACWDEDADQPCSWIRIDTIIRRGVCSACPGEVQRFDRGDRMIAVPAELSS